MKNTNANHVDTFMTRQQVIRITESLREQNLKIFRKTGYVRYAEWEKKFS